MATCSPRALKNVRLSRIELLDRAGKVVARSTRAKAFRIGKPTVPYPDRCLPYARQRPHGLSKAGTRPFDGNVSAETRHRLWLYVRMKPGFLRTARARPTRCRAIFTTLGGHTFDAHIDRLGTWPTG